MSNPNKFSIEYDKRNDNAEWAILKEAAAMGLNMTPYTVERERSPEEREKYRLRGEKLLRVINRMPDRLAEEEKTLKLDRIHRLARNIGISKDLDYTLQNGRDESYGRRPGDEVLAGNSDLTEDELERVERLREKVVDLTEVEPGALAGEFPSGNYLFHGSKMSNLEKILQTGALKNGVALSEDDAEITGFDVNSGFEGVSWSMNKIDALPGTRGHLAGFLAAPEKVLSAQESLVVPSRPAPYEVLQVGEGIDPKEFYDLKIQAETWGDGGVTLGEHNTVDSNLMSMLMWAKGNELFGEPKSYQYTGSLAAEDLRENFTINKDGRLLWDEDVFQEDKIPPALPWLQSVIDRGITIGEGNEKFGSVAEILNRAQHDEDLIMDLVRMERGEAEPINEVYKEQVNRASGVRIGVDEMYFVTSHKDLEDWLKVMARTGANPKGILLYDDDQVVMENFASRYEGNHEELSREIGRAMNVNDKFWKEEMGFNPEEAPRSGYVGQVLLESAVERDRVIRVKNGKLAIENVS